MEARRKPLFFEGSEKKLEMVLSSQGDDIRQKDWESVVNQAGAKILSKLSSKFCDAYLLSESSLFVWDRRFTLITCGRTTLVDVAIALFQEYGEKQVESLIFERKNEFFPQHQKSDVFEDLARLSKYIPGKAYRFGDANEHHLFLFHLDRDFCPNYSDHTLEILMYEIQGEAKEAFAEKPHSHERLRNLFAQASPLSGFDMSEYIFEPRGYSCNALKGDKYFTIHVTPQEISPYVSFETNIKSEIGGLAHSVIQIFQPKSFDLVKFRPGSSKAYDIKIPDYQVINQINQSVNCGYHVDFISYFQPPTAFKEALSLNLNSLIEEEL